MAAPGGASAGSVFVKRSGDESANYSFAEVQIFVGDTVTRLAERASTKFVWPVGADKVKLFLVRSDRAPSVEGGDESEGVGGALFSGGKLVDVEVVDGCFLLARLSGPPRPPGPPAAAPGERACARASICGACGAVSPRGPCARFLLGGLRGAHALTFSALSSLSSPIAGGGGVGGGGGGGSGISGHAGPTFESLLIAGGIAAPRASVVRRAFTRYGAAIVAALAAGGRVEAALDTYHLAESLPSLTTAADFHHHGVDVDGPLYEGSPVTRCFRSRSEFVLKPLDEAEYRRAKALCDALAGTDIPGLTHFELLTSGAGKRFMLMPLAGAALEVLPHLSAEDIHVLWQCTRDALRDLHARGFAHMDVKPANICLSARLFVLIDLGSVARFDEPTSTTIPYVPRDFPGKMRCSSALADWWLLAMTFAEKATGLAVGEVKPPTMAELADRLLGGLPRGVWDELRAELFPEA